MSTVFNGHPALAPGIGRRLVTVQPLRPNSWRIVTHIQQGLSMTRMVNCIKLGTEAPGLDFPPYPGELGKRIFESVSKQAWADWLKHQTMLVNENRLNLADQRARQYLARQMENHFFGDGADAAQGYVPPTN
jgi:Fe-S cluster biosynthesis and repair protein YggX